MLANFLTFVMFFQLIKYSNLKLNNILLYIHQENVNEYYFQSFDDFKSL
jgi:hypothetical protein